MSAKNISEYISRFPEEIQQILEQVRQTIQKNAPQAKETIKYQIPTFQLNGNLVHFAAFKNHIGFYPTPSGVEKFRLELTQFETSKGAIKFPLDQPIPYDLIAKVTRFRVAEQMNNK